MKEQRRGRKIAMTAEELEQFLADERTCRVATIGKDGPHATPLWFGWLDGCLWLYSIVTSQRWADLQHDPRIGVTIDAGVDYFELHGVEITGSVEAGEDRQLGLPQAGVARLISRTRRLGQAVGRSSS
jgi:general stress protein 26